MHADRGPAAKVGERLEAKLVPAGRPQRRGTTAAASFWLLALPAVTVPSFITGLRRASRSIEVSLRGPSSASNITGSPLRCGTGTATISPGELALVLGGHGLAMAGEGVLVLLLT